MAKNKEKAGAGRTIVILLVVLLLLLTFLGDRQRFL